MEIKLPIYSGDKGVCTKCGCAVLSTHYNNTTVQERMLRVCSGCGYAFYEAPLDAK